MGDVPLGPEPGTGRPDGRDVTGAVGPPAAAGPLVFVDDLGDPRPTPADDHHLRRVLRLRPGAPVAASDGTGSWRPCVLGPAGLQVAGPVEAVALPSPPLRVAFAPVKGDRPEWAVQKLTELGVDRITLLVAARSVVRWDGDRAGKHLARLTAVAREAASQCRRVRLPRLDGPVTPASLVGGVGVALASPDGRAPTSADRCLLVGPEGGWSDAELALPLPRVRLAPFVLRAETAAMAAAVLLGALREGGYRPDSTVREGDEVG